MQPSAWISLIVVALVFAVLWRRRGAPDVVFLGGVVGLAFLGILQPAEVLAGFSNPAVWTIGALFVVAAGLRHTGALDLVGDRILGNVYDERHLLRRLTFPMLAISALMNNTPLVAMLVPMLLDWCRKHRVSPSKVLLPVSYIAIMGGTWTLIGTSTNLVVQGVMIRQQQQALANGAAPDSPFVQELRPMHLFEIGYVGIPCAIAGTLFLLVWGRRRLPNRTDLVEAIGEQRREYLAEMEVQTGCRLIGQTVGAAGLRNLPGLFLVEIIRGEEVITPASPADVIHASDKLVFAGVVSTIVDLDKIAGLRPVADSTYVADGAERHSRRLTEVVLAGSSPVLGRTVRDANFRTHYGAAIVAVLRNGRRQTGKIGDIKLREGDTLLLQTRSDFESIWRNSPDFYLVSSVEGSRPRRHDKAVLSIGLLILLVVMLIASPWIDRQGSFAAFSSTAVISIAVAGLMIGFRCLPAAEARTSIDLPVVLTVGAALGLGFALDKTGAADAVAGSLVNLAGTGHPLLLLGLLYILTVIFTELITNTAVAAIMVPLAVAVAQQAALSPRPFVMAIALGASCSFITPIGYQTNMMVMGPGGYQPSDYLKAGLPLTLIIGVTAAIVIPWVWPFELAG